MSGWGHATLDSCKRKGESNSADGSMTGYNIGVYGTWYQNGCVDNGAYIDTWLQYSNFDNNVRGKNLSNESYDSHSIAGSRGAGINLN